MPSHASVVFEPPATGKPGTHVLIVGIGDYPHLLGGDQEQTALAENMGQLTTPSPSARALAAWFLDEFRNADKELASLALVLSEKAPATFTHPRALAAAPLPRGTANEVVDAIQAWVERSSTNIDNQVIFFFCGHGVSTSEPILLLRDFARNKLQRFFGALNLNGFLGAMQTMMPTDQLFLIDACQTPTSVAQLTFGLPHLGQNALDPSSLDDRGGTPARQSVHHATSSLARAFGRVDGRSLYTDALIQALNGGGATSDFRWWVGTPGLQTALGAYVDRLARKEKVIQEPERVQNARFKIHRPARIQVPLYVTSDPKEALLVARVEARLEGVVKAAYDHNTMTPCEEWPALLDHREHQIAVRFDPRSGYRDVEETLQVAPPELPHTLLVRTP